MASGADREACWCVSERFPAELLARLSPEQRGRSCICRRCLLAARESQAGSPS